MSSYRKPAGKSSKKRFSRSAAKVHRKNAGSAMRGGIRL